MQREDGWLGWWRSARPEARRALWAAALGWLLDAFDVMLYALVLTAVIADLGLTKATAGLIGSVTLVAGAVGGVVFGLLADRHGRTRALMASILMYSVFTALCGVAQTAVQLAIFRIGLGLGMGGEWASGAALVAETWPDEHRGKALGLMQSAWAVGYAAAATLNALILPTFGWRAVFFAGLLPALVTLWIRRSVDESPMWRQPAEAANIRLADVLRGPAGRLTWTLAAMNAATMFAWWGLFSWIPSFLSRPLAQGGAGLSLLQSSTWIVLMQTGMWCGYVSFGFIADAFGRRRTYVTYLLVAAVLVPIYAMTRDATVLLLLGPFVAFFGTGYFSGFGAVSAEIFPTRIRATAQGLTYNIGRGLSAAAPFTVGALASIYGLGAALVVTSAAFLLAALLWRWIPETRGRVLQ